MNIDNKTTIDYKVGSGKMNSFDWLPDLNFGLPTFNIVEVKFKGGRKEFFINKKEIELYVGDNVVCEMPSGYHIGEVSLKGDLVRLQLRRKRVEETEFKSIYRIATKQDLEKHLKATERNIPTLIRTREICKDMKLNLKLTDVEFQSDNTKATFYYTADSRVDFRELIKVLASEFKIRVEMRQISLRQEAARLGAIGSCGREICCATWMSNPKPVPNAAVKYQNLSSNPAKLSSHCGRLKCSLNFELETYIDARKGIPNVDGPLKTEKGDAILQKTDIFRKMMWFSYPKESNWHPITCKQVEKIQEMNRQGKKPIDLNTLVELGQEVEQKQNDEGLDIERINQKYPKGRRRPSRRRPNRRRKDNNQETKAKSQEINTNNPEATARPKRRNKRRKNRNPKNRTPKQ